MKTKKVKDKFKGKYQKEGEQLSDTELVYGVKDNLDNYLSESQKLQKINADIQTIAQERKKYLEDTKNIKQSKVKKYNIKFDKLKADHQKIYDALKEKETQYECYIKEIESRSGFKINIRNIWSVIIAVNKLMK